MEARGEKINVSSGPSKEIADMKKKMMKMMTLGLQDRVCGNSRMKRSRYVVALGSMCRYIWTSGVFW